MTKIIKKDMIGDTYNIMGQYLSEVNREALLNVPIWFYSWDSSNLYFMEETPESRIVSIASYQTDRDIDAFERIPKLGPGYYLIDSILTTPVIKFQPDHDKEKIVVIDIRRFNVVPPTRVNGMKQIFGFSGNRQASYRISPSGSVDVALYTANKLLFSTEVSNVVTGASLELIGGFYSAKFKLPEYSKNYLFSNVMPANKKKVMELPKPLTAELEDYYYKTFTNKKKEPIFISLVSLEGGKNFADGGITDDSGKELGVVMWIKDNLLHIFVKTKQEKAKVSNYLINQLRIRKNQIVWETDNANS